MTLKNKLFTYEIIENRQIRKTNLSRTQHHCEQFMPEMYNRIVGIRFLYDLFQHCGVILQMVGAYCQFRSKGFQHISRSPQHIALGAFYIGFNEIYSRQIFFFYKLVKGGNGDFFFHTAAVHMDNGVSSAVIFTN